MALIGAHLDQVETVAFFISDGVGADQFELGFQPSIDGVVVGGELDHGLLAGMEEGHILWTYLGLDQQVVFQRYHFDHGVTGLYHAANGVDLEQLDDAVHGGYHGGAGHPIVDGHTGRGDLLQLGAHLVEFLEGVRAESQFGLLDAAFDFRNGRFGTRDSQVGGIQGAAYLDGAAAQAKDFYLGNCAGFDQRLRHIQLLLQQAKTGAILLRFGTEFGQLLSLLLQLFLQGVLFALQALLARAVQGHFIFDQLWGLLHQVIRQDQWAPFSLGAEALHAGDQGHAVGFGFTSVGEKAGVVEA